MFEDVKSRPPLLEEPFAQTLSGKRKEYIAPQERKGRTKLDDGWPESVEEHSER